MWGWAPNGYPPETAHSNIHTDTPELSRQATTLSSTISEEVTNVQPT